MSTEKKEMRAKRDKKPQRILHPATTIVLESAAPLDRATREVPPEASTDVEKNKKRKRDTKPNEELEIDVNLPEPLSKAAARKAKRQKSRPDREIAEEGDAAEDGPGVDASVARSNGRKEGSAYGIWIGNLPWTIDKQLLATFLVTNAKDGAINAREITRIHMPAPPSAPVRKGADKPVNKGFAYVDFTSKAALDAALQLTETSYGGRNVLIKAAKNFDGRPKDHGLQAKAQDASAPHEQKRRKPIKRVFIGNLGFDCTKEDLSDHFAQCGYVEDVHIATFQDTGKCKGFAWVTFDSEEAAEAAARGFVIKHEDDAMELTETVIAEDGDTSAQQKKKKKKIKGHKWFVNRLLGRQLRIELAEDASTRYEKRFGKGAKTRLTTAGDDVMPAFSGHRAPQGHIDSKQKGDGAKKGRNSAAAYGGDGDSKYRTGGIVESAGTKVTFDD